MLEYAIITTIVLLSGSVWGWAGPAVTLTQILLTVAYCFINRAEFKKNYQSNLFVLFIVVIFYAFNIVFIASNNPLVQYLVFTNIICLFLFSSCIDNTEFVRKYINIIVLLSFASLFFWGLARIGISIADKVQYVSNVYYRMNIFYIYRASQDYVTINSFNIRNFGVFWEAGAFQAFVNIAIFALIIYKNNIKYWLPKLIILVLTVISTFSTTGYIILVVNVLLYLYKYVDLKQLKIRYYVLMFGIVIAVIAIVNSPTVVNKFSSDSSNVSYSIRLNDNINGLKVALINPIFGLGYNSEKYTDIVNGYGITANSSGILIMVQQFGIPFAIFFIYRQCKNFCITLEERSKVVTLLGFVMLLLIFSSEPFVTKQFFMLFIFKLYKNKWTALGNIILKL